MRILILLFGLLLTTFTNAETISKCFKDKNNSDLKLKITLEGDDWNTAYVEYKSGNGKLKLTKKSSEPAAFIAGRPTGFKYVWNEYDKGILNGTYYFTLKTNQDIEDFSYVRKKDNKTFYFVADDCGWSQGDTDVDEDDDYSWLADAFSDEDDEDIESDVETYDLSDVITSPKQDIKFVIQGSGGSNGVAVTYHPDYKLYYTAFAGNASFPLEVFTESGYRKQATTTSADLRGLWYNYDLDLMEGNEYSTYNLLSFTIGDNGYFDGDPYTELEDLDIVGSHTVLTYNAYDYLYAAYNSEDGVIDEFDMEDGSFYSSSDELDFPTSSANINTTSVIYTFIEDAPYGLLDYVNKKVFLFDYDGTYMKTINLPSNAPTSSIFCFSFANKHVFLFDKDERIWYGYKIIK